MFAQTGSYTQAESVALKINIPKVEAVSSLGSGYRFLWLKNNPASVTAYPDSRNAYLVLDSELDILTTLNVQTVRTVDKVMDQTLDDLTTYNAAAVKEISVLVYDTVLGAASLSPSHEYQKMTAEVTPISWSVPASGVGTGKSLIDGSSTYVDNSTSGVYNNQEVNPWAVGQILNLVSPTQVMGLTYVFDTTTTNYKKKIKYVDLYIWSGVSWVLAQTFTTTSPVVGASTSEVLSLTTPMSVYLPDPQFKIQCRSNWGDSYGYYYVTEFTVQTRTVG